MTVLAILALAFLLAAVTAATAIGRRSERDNDHFRRQVERRLSGLHNASQLLDVSAESDKVMPNFLSSVCAAFEANMAEIVTQRPEGLVINRIMSTGSQSYVRLLDPAGDKGLRAQFIKLDKTHRVHANDDNELAEATRAEGYSNCIVTPLPGRGINPGFLVVWDEDEVRNFDKGEVSVIEALAREVGSRFEKGKLFEAIVEERYKLSRIVDSTYDGVMQLSSFGIIKAWNPGWEQITGILTSEALGHELDGLIDILRADGSPANIGSWSSAFDPLAEHVELIDRAGTRHWLQCSYRAEFDQVSGEGMLVVVAHDKSDEREIEQLREDVDRLEELEAASRERVLQVQESLQPSFPKVPEAEFGVFYQPSDDTAPTGGDMYDWQLLPSGDVHIAVVDVLGSGIDATNDAFAVIHTMRTLAYQGIPVEQLVVEADNLLATLNPELVATVMCVRYNPTTGRMRLAGGGHPPVLIVRANGEVEEIAAPGIPVGWPTAGSDHPVDVALAPSESIIVYTDGLIEAHRDILQGLQALANNAKELSGYPVNEMARALVERSLKGAARRDDSLAIVIRHRGLVRKSGGDKFDYRAKSLAREVPQVRHAFTEWLEEQLDLARLADDLSIVISELATNSARLGVSFFEIRAQRIDGGVVVEIEDDGPGFDYEAGNNRPSDESESGRGLMIIEAMVDELSVQRTARGCLVRVVANVPNPAENVNASATAIPTFD